MGFFSSQEIVQEFKIFCCIKRQFNNYMRVVKIVLWHSRENDKTTNQDENTFI